MPLTTQSTSMRNFNNENLPQVNGNFVKFKVEAELYIDMSKEHPENTVNDIETMLHRGMVDMEIATNMLSVGNLYNSAWKVKRANVETSPPPELDVEVYNDICDQLYKERGDKWLRTPSHAMDVEVYKRAMAEDFLK